MCQLITAATYLLKRNNSAEDAYPAHLNWVKQIQSGVVSRAYTSSLIQALWKNVCSLEVQLLCSTAACAQEEVSPKENLCVRCWKPTYEPADPKSPNLRSVRSSCSAIQQKKWTGKHKHANTQIKGKIHGNSLPKLEAEIMRATVPIPTIFPVKKQVLTSARLHGELKMQEVWQRSPLQKGEGKAEFAARASSGKEMWGMGGN